MQRRSARSAAIAAQGKEDADHGVEPRTGVEAAGQPKARGRGERNAGAKASSAQRENAIESSEFDDGAASVRIAADAGGEDDEDPFGCDECAIKEATNLVIRSRLTSVQQNLKLARLEIERLRAESESGSASTAAGAINQVVALPEAVVPRLCAAVRGQPFAADRPSGLSTRSLTRVRAGWASSWEGCAGVAVEPVHNYCTILAQVCLTRCTQNEQ